MKMLLNRLPFNIATLFYRNNSLVRHSAIFINGNKATETFVYVVPQIDFPDQIKDKSKLENNIKRRKLAMSLNDLEQLWFVYNELKNRKKDLDIKKADLSREMGILMKNKAESSELNKYKIQLELVKDNLRKIKEPFWCAEERAVVESLKLPNIIHPLTPDNNPTVIHSQHNPPSNNKNHLDIGADLNLLHFKKNENYYLKGEAAVFELGVKFYFSDLLKKNNFVQFSNPDFVKSVIIEGCGEDHTNADSTFILHHNEDSKVNIDLRLHLSGGGSFPSFMAYHAKNVIYPKTMPLLYFTMGRQYVPAPSDEDSLFHVSQSAVIQVFNVVKTAEDLDVALEKLTNILKEAFNGFGCHYRMVYLPADKLLNWESLRLSVQMFSTSLKSYIEVGNVSLCGDYVSKRLMFTYLENKQNYFPHILTGTIINVPKLLGCYLEQEDSFKLPHHFQPEYWSVKK